LQQKHNKKQMQKENNTKKKTNATKKIYLLQQRKNATTATKRERHMRDATSGKKSNETIEKLLVAIAKQHYCNNRNKKSMRDTT